MPENKDSDWDWSEFVARNNNELVATWGNLANRVLSFSHRNWDGCVPAIPLEALRPGDRQLLAGVETGFETVGRELEAVHLRAGLQEAMRLASTVNQYLDQTAPWTALKVDREGAALSVFTALRAVDSLKILFSPYLPETSQHLHGQLGYEEQLFGESYTQPVQDDLGEHRVLRYRPPAASQKPAWNPSGLEPGRKLGRPAPLFRKLDEAVAEVERAKLGK